MVEFSPNYFGTDETCLRSVENCRLARDINSEFRGRSLYDLTQKTDQQAIDHYDHRRSSLIIFDFNNPLNVAHEYIDDDIIRRF